MIIEAIKKIFHSQKNNTLRLIEKYPSIKKIILELYSPLGASLGQEFFESISQRLNHLIESDFLLIGKYNATRNEIETLASCKNGKIIENFVYSLEHTPCETIIGKDICSYSSNVQKLFPNDKWLKDHKIEGYTGIPLFNSLNIPNGIIVALFTKPQLKVKSIETILYLYSNRISAEIEHQEIKNELQAKNLELTTIKQSLTKNNQQLDLAIKEIQIAKNRAEESDQLKSSFLANLSHEIRTPMNVILGFSELLRSHQTSPEEQNEFIEIINQNGNHLLRIMDSLIDISRLQARSSVTPPELIHINELISNLHKNYTEEIETRQKPIDILLDLPLSPPNDTIVTDREGLFKIFDHLLDNAIKFTSMGWIKIGYTEKEESILFYIEDTGIGITHGHELSIFDMFRQIDLKNSRQFGGNGIGLSIAKKYTELMNGKIWAEENRQKGACFFFELPRN